jgi:hypothetical protein
MPGGVVGRLVDIEGVLSIGKIGGGNGDPSYYLDAVASGQEDY